MGLFVLRYLSTLSIFVLGLKAPGIMQNAEYFSLNDAARNFTLPVSFDATRALNTQTKNYNSGIRDFGLTSPRTSDFIEKQCSLFSQHFETS